MTQDITTQVPQAITDPETGEMIERSDAPRVADLLRRVKDVKRGWTEVEKWCAAALQDFADERSEWTLNFGHGLSIKVDAPSVADIDWDMDLLHQLEAILPPERYGELIVQVVSEKPQTGKLQALARQAGSDSEVGRIINEAERRKPKARYARVVK